MSKAKKLLWTMGMALALNGCATPPRPCVCNDHTSLMKQRGMYIQGMTDGQTRCAGRGKK